MCKLLGCPGLNAPFIIPDEPKLSCINVILYLRASLVAQTVKNLPAMQETWVWSLGWEDHLGEEMATYSGILAWRIPWTEEPGGLQSTGSQRMWHNWATNTHTHTHTHTSFTWRFFFFCFFHLFLCTEFLCALYNNTTLILKKTFFKEKTRITQFIQIINWFHFLCSFLVLIYMYVHYYIVEIII